MNNYPNLIIFRGGGDVATGSIQKIFRVGYPIIVLEMPFPTTVRKTVALSEAVYLGEVQIEDVPAKLCHNYKEAFQAIENKKVAILIDPKGKAIWDLKPLAVVDSIIAKKNIGTNRSMAPITIALGPGFVAGHDVDVVIETNRGHDLGKLIFKGSAAPNTHQPGNIDGYTLERVLRAPCAGRIQNYKQIGDIVTKGEVLSIVNGEEIRAKINGVVRGMIENSSFVHKGMKIGDVDPRYDTDFNSISDKARNIGGGTLEALLILQRYLQQNNSAEFIGTKI